MPFDPWSYCKSGNEHAHQAALFMWANVALHHGPQAANELNSYMIKGHAETVKHRPDQLGKWGALPQLEWLHAIPNQGTASAKRGADMKAEGVKSGVADMFLPYPMQGATRLGIVGYSGLYIELKRPKSTRGAEGKPSDAQKRFRDYAIKQGYAHIVAVGWEAARDGILEYLGVKL